MIAYSKIRALTVYKQNKLLYFLNSCEWILLLIFFLEMDNPSTLD